MIEEREDQILKKGKMIVEIEFMIVETEAMKEKKENQIIKKRKMIV